MQKLRIRKSSKSSNGTRQSETPERMRLSGFLRVTLQIMALAVLSVQGDIDPHYQSHSEPTTRQATLTTSWKTPGVTGQVPSLSRDNSIDIVLLKISISLSIPERSNILNIVVSMKLDGPQECSCLQKRYPKSRRC